MDIGELLQLIELVCSKPIAEFELEEGGFRLRVTKPVAPVAPEISSAAPAPMERVVMPSAPQATVADTDKSHVIRSPMVGTFFRSASPAAEPYVKVGDRINKGQVLCIIEAMKLMNEIESETSGVISEVSVENGQPVEFGEPLFRVTPET